MNIIEDYNRLLEYVGLDLLDMEGAFMTTPRIHQEAGELAVRADEAENHAKHNLEIITAAAAARLREVPINGKEPSQARIDSMLPLDEEVQQARNALTTAISEAGVCKVLYRTLGEQSRLLSKATDMITSGYLNPAALHDQRRAEIRRAAAEARRARPAD